jgi:hypothetical protein
MTIVSGLMWVVALVLSGFGHGMSSAPPSRPDVIPVSAAIASDGSIESAPGYRPGDPSGNNGGGTIDPHGSPDI